MHLKNLPYRSIQIGLCGIAVTKYASEWIHSIKDITYTSKVIQKMIARGDLDKENALMPLEDIYPISEQLKKIIGHS